MHPLKIAPSLLAADFSYLRGDIARVEQGGADLLHLDIMDGHFVPNISFGPALVKKIRSVTKLPFDVHLMLSRPRQFITPFIQAGATNITFHIECEDHIMHTIYDINTYPCGVGLSVKPKTPLRAVSDYLNYIQRLLIMTVEPGFGGQAFMPEMLDKVREAVSLRTERNLKFDIEVDGGLDRQTIGAAVAAGAEVIVAGTAIFGEVDAEAAIRWLREAAAAGAKPGVGA